MKIGGCWFNDARGELVNRASGDVWHLPRAELQVLRLLAQCPGKVVPKADLRGGDEKHPPLSDSSVTRAVFMLRSFIGPGAELVIETVKGQGYVLLVQAPSSSADERPVGSCFGSWRRIALAMVLLLVMAVGVYHSWRGVERVVTMPYQVKLLPQADGQLVRLALYAHSRSNNTLLVEEADMIGRVLAKCRGSRWRDVFLSLSHDTRVLNLTLRGEYMGQSQVRNLKFSDGREPREFISTERLEQVNICD